MEGSLAQARRRPAVASVDQEAGIVKLTLIPSTVLGSPDSYHYCTSAIVNDTLAIDAGCLGFYHSAQEQARIRHLLITHTHIDHMASLPIFVENAYEGKTDCVTIHA